MKVIVKWQKEKYDVDVDVADSVEVFRAQLWTLTGVPPERQKIMGFKGGILKDDADLSKLITKDGQSCMLMGTAGELPEKPAEKVVFVEDIPGKVEEINSVGVGLKNLGNTCYMNATFQALRHAKGFTKELLSMNPLLWNSHPQGAFFRAVHEFMGQMERQNGTIVPYNFLEALRTAFPQFREMGRFGYKQQDADECWSQSMSLLHQIMRGTNSSESEKGLIYRSFGLRLQNRYECKEQTDEEPQIDVETVFKLPCHITMDVNYLADGIRLSMEEELEKQSISLGRSAIYSKKQRIARLPKYLTVQFVRFQWRRDVQARTKILRKVNFPLSLDLYDFCSDDLQKELNVVRRTEADIKDEKFNARESSTGETAVKKSRVDAAESMEVDSAESSEKKVRTSDVDRALQSCALERSIYPPEFPSDTDESSPAEETSEEKAKRAEALQRLLADKKTMNCLTGRYSLSAVLTHKGREASSGHYVTWAKDDKGDWYRYDDDTVTLSSAEEVEKLSGGGDWFTAYILLYEAKEPELE